MSAAIELESHVLKATDGDVAVINFESAHQGAWSKFWRSPNRVGLAEHVLEQEAVALTFLGQADALDRMEMVAAQIARTDPVSAQSALIHAQVASATHRFSDAADYLEKARWLSAPPVAVNRLALAVDQACGTRLGAVLAARRQIAAETRHLEDLVPLGALLADLGQCDEADQVFRDALQGYRDVSPFARAWVCFQLGVLWGESVPDRQSDRAAQWYRVAVAYLPSYVKARVHLAETYLDCGRHTDAEVLLIPAIPTGDPEVHWRLGDVSAALGKSEDAANQIESARIGFERLLAKHLLAYADHAAEFYAGSGNDPARAYELAAINLTNRATLRAFALAHATALGAGEAQAASEILAAAQARWGQSRAFASSFLAGYTHGTIV